MTTSAPKHFNAIAAVSVLAATERLALLHRLFTHRRYTRAGRPVLTSIPAKIGRFL